MTLLLGKGLTNVGFFLKKMILCHIGLYKTSLHIFYFYRAFRSSFFQHFSFLSHHFFFFSM